LKRWLFWQCASRLAPGPIAVNFVDNTRLLVYPGMTGATGNIYTGLHEFQDMSFVLHLLRSDDIFVDVGANIGAYTILAGGVIGAHCIAIEPIPETFQHLIENINLNQIWRAVNPINMGISHAEGILKFSSDKDTMNHVITDNQSPSCSVVNVKVVSLDNIIGDLNPRLIKIDVEGFETNIISGASMTLSRPSLDAVIIELSGYGNRYGYDDIAVKKNISDYGFKPFSYLPFERTLEPLSEKPRHQHNTLYVRNVDSVRQKIATAPPFYVHGFKL